MKILTRQHEIYAARVEQLQRNTLALRGGQPYINARLWRAPNESSLSWTGNGAVVGRRDRAALVNDAGRVAGKIGQYLFKTPTKRDGIGEEWAKNVNGHGQSINLWWMDLSDYLTAGQWVWVNVDRLAPLMIDGVARQRTIAEQRRDGDFVRWTIWPSISVPDWSYGEDGKLNWLITESMDYDNSDPFTEPTKRRLRTLWQRVDGRVEIRVYAEKAGTSGGAEVLREATLGLAYIPFVLVGRPSAEPWWYDDVELMQAQVMNLDSLHIDNLVKTVFPQLVIPASMLNELETKLIERSGINHGETIMEAVREVVRGLDHPLVEASEDKGTTRFLQPSGSELNVLSLEMERKRRLLFDVAGLSLFTKETRQIQTAESKQFDQLDTESTLQHRAVILQEAERRLVEFSKLIDPNFSEYDPVWPNSFDVVDIEAEASTISMIAQMPRRTNAMDKMAMLASVRVLESMGGIDQELIDEARQEIEEYEAPKFEEFYPMGSE